MAVINIQYNNKYCVLQKIFIKFFHLKNNNKTILEFNQTLYEQLYSSVWCL